MIAFKGFSDGDISPGKGSCLPLRAALHVSGSSLQQSVHTPKADGFAIGVDLGGTNLRIASFDSDWKRLASIALPTRVADGPEAVVMDMCAAIRQVREEGGRDRELIGIGIGSPGPLELPSGKFHVPPNLPGFDGFRLKDAVESILETPVIVDCDANLAALAEWKTGAGKSIPCNSMCMLTLGTGVGSGIILDRAIWHGMIGMGGEAGHLPLVPDGLPCGCGGRGCLEQYASATAISRAAQELARTGNAVAIAKLIEETGQASARDLAVLARAGDQPALDLYIDVGKRLGMALAGLVNILNVPLYVIGGGVASAWDLFGPKMLEQLRELSYVYRLTEPADHRIFEPEKTYVLPAALGPDAGLLGAAMLPYLQTAAGVPPGL